MKAVGFYPATSLKINSFTGNFENFRLQFESTFFREVLNEFSIIFVLPCHFIIKIKKS